jgi:exodeoxyribonuclease V beta subunit
LKQRLPNYDYDLHIGGVVYLFLRGMAVGQQTGVFQTRLSLEHVNALDELFSGEQKTKHQNNKQKDSKVTASSEAVQYGLF